jgi:hypothetical protein
MNQGHGKIFVIEDVEDSNSYSQEDLVRVAKSIPNECVPKLHHLMQNLLGDVGSCPQSADRLETHEILAKIAQKVKEDCKARSTLGISQFIANLLSFDDNFCSHSAWLIKRLSEKIENIIRDNQELEKRVEELEEEKEKMSNDHDVERKLLLEEKKIAEYETITDQKRAED